MRTFEECPNCEREAKEDFSHNHFNVYKCLDCETLYCEHCAENDKCPECGSSNYTIAGKVYS